MNSDLKDDELLLTFLEPKFVKVEIVVTGSEEDEDEYISTANSGVINDYIEAMHEMEFTMIDENPIAALDSSRVACLSLTAENGIVHDYYFTAEGYMVNDDIVYEIGETDITIPLTPEPDWSDNELLNNMEQVDGPLR
ncbi:MAG: hypothetical protein K5888_00095 [Lachnospiraceae bacterium]|nr:hypothetical protein [Lachnospiraceae bacterium]